MKSTTRRARRTPVEPHLEAPTSTPSGVECEVNTKPDTRGGPAPIARQLAVYVRVSSSAQDLRSQVAELERWLAAYAGAARVEWYQDRASGANMERPEWRRLEAAIRGGAVERLVVWRLDRLGRTAAGLTALLEELTRLAVGFVSIREGIDLATPAGRMLSTILAGVAAYEREVLRERQRAGIAAAKAAGKRWGGRKAGARWKVTPELERQARKMRDSGETVAAIARGLRVSRSTVYAILDPESEGRAAP